MDFKAKLEKRVEDINHILTDHTPVSGDTRFGKICDAVGYSINAGGKRLRPMFILESFRLCRKDDRLSEKDAFPFMAAIEMIHTYSLVHDDLPAMDNDLLRRGLPTTHAKFGEDFGILAGDALLNAAHEVMLGRICSSPEKRFAQAAEVISRKAGIFGMVGGQCLDVELTGKPLSGEDIDFIFTYKTGALIEASLMAGGFLAEASSDQVKLLEEAGHALGMAFQIRDDILDVTGTEEEIGKPVGSDERNDKTTYVSLYGLEKAEEDVNIYTEQAIGKLKQIGENDYLFELIGQLASRKK